MWTVNKSCSYATSGEPNAAQTKDIPKRKLAVRQAGMALAEIPSIRRHPSRYKKDTRARATRMIALEGDDDPMAVWCICGMKPS